ncbi:MAG: hypothetical protein A2622_00580 [Bdellovibrionales bacterium RIFCSPHIGHO2_01_FULL_40_29]|nr:MAG: hypothetical protein A2622_00580 [Bdellovibrionales bacterium RIFCSPHIGHO2_01_FULL_40_29]OFZ32617.1 MAG: hypothetical protein A3D17_05180 [Bdellovibrionales bacterium RIFCSPHIGHO2_02_FULL_40_15]
MKTFNLLKISASVVVFSVITSLVACGGKNDGGDIQPVPNNTVTQQCVNCYTLFQGYSEAYLNYYGTEVVPTLTMNLTFHGQNQIPQQTAYNPMYPYQGGGYYSAGVIGYNGPVSVIGVLSVRQPMTMGYCQIPVGDYSIGTAAQGIWGAGIISNLRMQAVGGSGTLFLTMTQGQVAAKTGAQSGQLWNSEVAPVGRIFGDVMFESINGYNCGQSILVQ